MCIEKTESETINKPETESRSRSQDTKTVCFDLHHSFRTSIRNQKSKKKKTNPKTECVLMFIHCPDDRIASEVNKQNSNLWAIYLYHKMHATAPVQGLLKLFFRFLFIFICEEWIFFPRINFNFRNIKFAHIATMQSKR